MYVYLFKSVALRQFQKGIEVGVVAVYAAVGNQAVQMQARSLFLRVVHRLQQRLVLKEITVFDLLRDPGQILVHDPAGPYVQMAHLGAAHLFLRKANGHAAGIALHEGALLHQPVQYRGFRQRDGIVLTLLIQAESVKDQQHGRPLLVRLLLRLRGA